MELARRRKTPAVTIGSLCLGGNHPIVVQSMTNTPTADIEATVRQTVELIEAGSEMVRLTVNDDSAARAVPEIVKAVRGRGHTVPIIGDFHFNGHTLLSKHPACARALDKYRINPGNVGKRDKHDANFLQIIKIAVDNDKAVRIGVNWGSLDQELVADLMDKNARRKKTKDSKEIVYAAMIQSALQSAGLAGKAGLRKNKIVLSVKMSQLQDMVTVYSRLARECDYALHLGLTEAGGDVQGISASSAALAILLQQGIGDTIRVSLTPQPDVRRAREVEVCRSILQSLGLRYFFPTITSCPGCGRTASHYFQHLAQDIQAHVQKNISVWKKKYPGVERLTVAVMGCVVNGPGESRHADIGISLPGASEKPTAPVYADGKKIKVLKGSHIKEEFIGLLEDYIRQKFSQGCPPDPGIGGSS